MNPNNNMPILQNWTFKKIVCYLVYVLFAKHIPGKHRLLYRFGNRFRSFLCRNLFQSCAEVITVCRGVMFDTGANIIMHDHSNIGQYCMLDGNHATITIGCHVSMGSHCIILCQNHKYLSEGYDGYEGKNVVIGDYAWIGHRVIILPGVLIGKHAIIGAGSVVSKDIPDYAVAVGNPATIKKYRNIVNK